MWERARRPVGETGGPPPEQLGLKHRSLQMPQAGRRQWFCYVGWGANSGRELVGDSSPPLTQQS